VLHYVWRAACQVGAPRQLRTIIEGESLVNDGTAYVLFFLLRVCTLSLPCTSSCIVLRRSPLYTAWG